MTKDIYVQIPLEDDTYPVKPSKRAVRRPIRRLSPCNRVLLTLLVVFIILPFLLAVFVGVSGYYFIATQVKSLTVTEPRDFPVVEYPEGELVLTKDRASLFFDTLRAGRVPTNDLIITAGEVNGLIASSDYLRGHAFVGMEENKLTFDTSLPTEFLPGGSGRYFVTSGVATVTDDTLEVNIDAPIEAYNGKILTGLLKFSLDERKHHSMILVHGKLLDMEPCDHFYEDNHNLLAALDDDELLDVLDGIESIKVEGNQIVFRARKTPLRASFDYVETFDESRNQSSGNSKGPWHLLRRLF